MRLAETTECGTAMRGGASSLFAILMLAGPLNGQATDTVLTLGGARTLLRQHSPQYQSALASADRVGQQVWSAWGAWIPSATLRIDLNRNEFTTRTFLDPTGVPQELDDPITSTAKSANQGLIFGWALFDQGRRFFDISAAKASARAADWGTVSTLVLLESQAEVQYWEALKQQDLARLARELLAARQRDVEIAQARFRIAAVAQTDVLQAEVAVGQNEVAVLQADQQADAARRELSVTLGLEDIDYMLRDSATVFDPTLLVLDTLIGMARSDNPEIARLNAEVEAANKSLWSARGVSWLPTVNLSLSFSRSEQLPQDASLFEFAPRNSSTNFGVSLSWPLINGLQKKWRTGQESARVQESRHNLLAQLLETDKEVRNQYESLVTAYLSVQIRTRLVGLARESVRLTTERYRIGAASYIELQQATNQATDAARGLIEARYSFMQTLARLEGAIGRPLPRAR
jgi:outer membrane protein